MKYIYILSLFVCLSSCSFNKQESFLEQLQGRENVRIEGTVLKCDSIIWGGNLIDIIDNKLIIHSFKTDYAFTTFSVENDKILKEEELIKKGNGPFEMVYPKCFVDHSDKSVYFYDINGSNITIYNVKNEDLDMSKTTNWIQNNKSDLSNYFWSANGGLATMTDGSFLMLGGTLNKGNMLSIIDQHSNRIIDTDVDFPADNCETEFIVKRQVYNNGGIEKRPTGNQFLCYCLEGNYAEIISFKNGYEAERKIIINDFPIYTTANDGYHPKGDKNNLRGLAAYTTNQYIYIMPYPLRHKDFVDKDNYKGYPTWYNDVVYVFNWNGDFVKSYTLNKLIETSFVVDKNDTTLFGITTNENGDYQVLKFYL